MVTFTKDEIIPFSKVSRNFGLLLKKLKERKLEKIAVMKNNEMEAIILSYDEYELLNEIFEYGEYKNIYETLKNRKDTSQHEYKSFETILENLGIRSSDL